MLVQIASDDILNIMSHALAKKKKGPTNLRNAMYHGRYRITGDP